MKRRTFLIAIGGVACGVTAPPRRFARSLLGVARAAGELSAADERFTLIELARIEQLAAPELKRARPETASRVLSDLLFERLGFVREVKDESLSFVLLPSVLRQRRGSCVGLSTLFLALCDGCGVSANGVLMPGHFYVRLTNCARARNVELLRGGEAMPDAWYRERFPIAGVGAAEYARPLSPDEALGVIEYDVGNERRRQLRLDEAQAAFLRAVRAFPGFAEAHASLGTTLHLLGRLDEAAASYERASALNPQLSGLAWNRSLLENERRASTL
jgi:tetratricopeptide (TPR) repeat protein